MLSVDVRHRMGDFVLNARFEAPPGITVLFGRSGSGKTTIVNAVAGLVRPTEGRIAIGERVVLDTDRSTDLAPHRRRVGYIFQEGRLFPHLNVRQNLTYGRWFSRVRPQRSEVDRIVEMLGIGPLLDRKPLALSGGEKQRVAIGRALLCDPDVVLADEPLASLDEARKSEILPYFEQLRDEVSVPILYVSHAAAEVARLATTVVVLDAGRVVQQGPAVDILRDPMVTPTGAREAGAVIEARVTAHHEDGLSEVVAGGIPLTLFRISADVGETVRIRVAARDVLISRDAPVGLSALNVLPGTVETVRHGEGPGVLVSMRTPAGVILARITKRSAQVLGLETGATCHAVIKAIALP